MPSDFAVHSDLLVHWTGKDFDKSLRNATGWKWNSELKENYWNRLLHVLQVGFWMTNQPSHHIRFDEGRIPIPGVPRMCFTELKLSQSIKHARDYGRLGIAVKRPYVFERGGRPVIYYSSERNWIKNDLLFKNCASDITDRGLLQYFKEMHAGKTRPINYDFYDESEWRIVLSL